MSTVTTAPAISRRAALTGLAALGAGEWARSAHAETRPNIVIAVQQNPTLLDPFLDISNVSYRVQDNIWDYLISTDYLNDLKNGPMLATEWHRTDDRTLEFTLRQGVKFHDGTEMTAEDVAFTFGDERIMSPSSRGYAPSRPFLGTIEKVEATGPYAVRLTTKQPDPLIERRLAGWGAQIVSKRAFLAAKDWDAWGRAPVGTGPYKVSEFKSGQSILLVAHDQYWGGPPPAASVKFQIVPEIAARMAGLSAGDYDLITEVPARPVRHHRQLQGPPGRRRPNPESPRPALRKIQSPTRRRTRAPRAQPGDRPQTADRHVLARPPGAHPLHAASLVRSAATIPIVHTRRMIRTRHAPN